MKEYTIIGDFSYENKQYTLLLDDEKKYFFLKINSNSNYEYITLRELIELGKLFSHNNNVLLVESQNYTYPYNNNEQLNQYSTNYKFQYAEKKKKRKLRIIPKILIGAAAVVVSISLLGAISHNYNSHSRPVTPTTSYSVQTTEKVEYDNFISSTEAKDLEGDPTQIAINKVYEEIQRQTENFKVEDEKEGFHLKLIYDSSKLDGALGYSKESITYDIIKNTINSNNEIPQKYKTLYLKLASNLEQQYPKMDLRVWYENLKTMQIIELDEMEMKVKAHSVDAYACYRKDENIIYTVKGYDYQPGTWEYQVIMHEMCHPIRSAFLKKGNEEIRVQFENQSGDGVIIEESLNSLLAVRSYDPNERDVAYQLQSNMMEVIVDSLDNYTYQDFVEHNITYLENEMNKQNNNDQAVEILSLISLQYKDYHDNKIHVDQSQFYAVYDYIAKMFYDKNINSSMSYTEAQELKDTLVDKITFDVPAEYEIDISHFDNYFNEYCANIGISNAKGM